MDQVDIPFAGVIRIMINIAADVRRRLAILCFGVLVAAGALPAVAAIHVTSSSSGNLAHTALSVTVSADAADIGAPKSLWVAAYVPNVGLFFKNGSGQWLPWRSGSEPPAVLSTNADTVNYTILDGSQNLTSLSGVQIYVGFTQNFTELGNSTDYALVYTIGGLTLDLNLDATAPIISQGTQNVSIGGAQLDASSAASPAAYQTRVVDSAGRMHVLKVQLTRIAPRTWIVATAVDNGFLIIAPTTLVFDGAGIPISGASQQVNYAFPSPLSAYGNSPFSFMLSFPGITEGSTPYPGSVATDDTAPINSVIRIYGTNLNANSPLGTVQAYSAAMLDPLGASHAVKVTLVKTASNSWATTYSVDGIAATDPVSPLPFNTQGLPTSGTLVAASFNYNGAPGGAGLVEFTINLSGITQSALATATGNVETRVESPVSVTNPTTFTASTHGSVYDAQGIPHAVALFFTKVAINTWETQISLDGATPVPAPGYMTFAASGNIASGSEIAFLGSIASDYNVQAPFVFDVNFAGSTQLGGPFLVR